MEVRLAQNYIIYGSANSSNFVVSKILDKDYTDIPLDKLRLSTKQYYSTIFGALQGLHKRVILESNATSFLELEKVIEKLSIDCQVAFNKANADFGYLKQIEELTQRCNTLQAEVSKLKKAK